MALPLPFPSDWPLVGVSFVDSLDGKLNATGIYMSIQKVLSLGIATLTA